MDDATRRERLMEVERHVTHGNAHIARQKKIIAELERHGQDTDCASVLLRQFEEMQLLHVEHRDRLEQELGTEPALPAMRGHSRVSPDPGR
jgi:hypothetical protein